MEIRVEIPEGYRLIGARNEGSAMVVVVCEPIQRTSIGFQIYDEQNSEEADSFDRK